MGKDMVGAWGRSEILVTFTIAETTPAITHVFGNHLTPSGSSIRRHIIQLVGAASGTLLDFSEQGIGAPGYPFNLLLQPDTYTLYFKSEDAYWALLGQSWTDDNFHFIVPAPSTALALFGSLMVVARRRRA